MSNSIFMSLGFTLSFFVLTFYWDGCITFPIFSKIYHNQGYIIIYSIITRHIKSIDGFIFRLNSKKMYAGSHRALWKTYVQHISLIKKYEYWSWRFRSDVYDTVDKERRYQSEGTWGNGRLSRTRAWEERSRKNATKWFWYMTVGQMLQNLS